MNLDAQRREFIRRGMSFENVPYIWAGDDPTGLDCSGLVIECLKSIGRLAPGRDLSAQGLYDTFVKGHNRRIKEPVAGALLFWHTQAGNIYHVAICIDSDFCITADGGGRSVKTIEGAVKNNAFIKIRPWNHRRTKPLIANIFQEAKE